MSVWYCIPSKRPPAEAEKCLSKWRERGYKLAVWRDEGPRLPDIQLSIFAPYDGYAKAVNQLVNDVLDHDPSCDWVVTGGDDVWPDPNHTADEIAAQCSEHFAGTFGVMQPTGDRWGDDAASRVRWPDAPAMIDRICGSPWMGREFCQRINQGNGPLWHEYRHNWVDEELQNVAIQYGCFWRRRDLTHYHDHSRRDGGPWLDFQQGFDADYRRMHPLFDARKKMGFPGSEPL